MVGQAFPYRWSSSMRASSINRHPRCPPYDRVTVLLTPAFYMIALSCQRTKLMSTVILPTPP